MLEAVKTKTIELAHGDGGLKMQELISEVFLKHFGVQAASHDAAYLNLDSSEILTTTDSFVVSPLFFPGADIGKISICGTLNDLAVSGAKPVALTASFILEEGLSLSDLEKIVVSMAKETESAGVKIVTGDTKVVEKGKADGVFINTTGIGLCDKNLDLFNRRPEVGDKIIVSGSIGDHGSAILLARNEFKIESEIISDCSNVYPLVRAVSKSGLNINWMRDPTRGGLATSLIECAEKYSVGIDINEKDIPIRKSVAGICNILGFDPLYLANEGKVVFVAPEETLEIISRHPLGQHAQIIGEVLSEHPSEVLLHTVSSGARLIKPLMHQMLPRIC